MIDFEQFHTLKEIQSLDLKIAQHMEAIKKEEERILYLKKQRESKTNILQEKEADLLEIKKTLRTDEKELADIQNRLSKARQRFPLLTSDAELKATEKEIQSLTQEQEILEEKIFKYMEKVEFTEREIEELKNFLQGSEKSMATIQLDVEQNIEKEKRDIENYGKRIAALIETLLPLIKSRFLAVNERYRFKRPLTYVVQDSCQECKMTVNRKDQSNIDKGSSLESCTNCGRIFLPSSLK